MTSKLLNGVYVFCALLIPITTAQARPVSYPGGWTLMQMNDGDSNSLHIHYSPSAHYSVGYKGEYVRGQKYMLNGLQTNILLNRWNNKDSQANLYLKSFAGIATGTGGESGGDNSGALWSGLAADWETRRWFTAYENKGLLAGDIDTRFVQKARIGVAPYIAEYGGIHTWLILEARHEPKAEDNLVLTPLVRFFKGPALVDAGISENRDILFNFVYRY